MPELSQIAVQIAFGPIQMMMVEERERLWAAAVYARGGMDGASYAGGGVWEP